MHDGKPQPGAARFGGEERLEEPGARPRREARAPVAAANLGFIEGAPGGNLDAATGWRRLERVQRKVHEDLAESLRVARDRGERGIGRGAEAQPAPAGVAPEPRDPPLDT